MSADTRGDNDLLHERINVRGYFERLLQERDKRDAERDKRLDERFEAQEKAVTAALAAAEKAVTAALAAAKEAVTKAEVAAKETMHSHNDLIRQSRDRDATYATQTELGHISAGLEDVKGFQSKLLGALILVSVMFPLGIALVVYFITRSGG